MQPADGEFDFSGNDIFPFESPVRARRLADPVAEPPRFGEAGRPCPECDAPDDEFVWVTDDWRLKVREPSPLRGVLLLSTREHVDSFADLPDALAAEFGPLVARIERAILKLGGIGRVHVSRWGDGGAHFHVWFIPRPLGRQQLRGSLLPAWMLVLPNLPPEELTAAGRAVAAELAATGRS